MCSLPMNLIILVHLVLQMCMPKTWQGSVEQMPTCPILLIAACFNLVPNIAKLSVQTAHSR